MLMDVRLCILEFPFLSCCTSTQQCLSSVMLPFFSFRSSLM